MPRFETLHRVRTAASLVRPTQLALWPFRCPICGPSILLGLSAEATGERRGGVQCRDAQRLGFPGASFEVCTSTEVFEHVPDDARGFREVRRVLREGGVFVFTVPLAFRNYGRDITARLRASGFAAADIDWRFKDAFLGQGVGVVVARA